MENNKIKFNKKRWVRKVKKITLKITLINRKIKTQMKQLQMKQLPMNP